MPGRDKAVKLRLLDDWSSTKTRYRRGFEGMSSTPREHSGAPKFNAQIDGKGKSVPEFDQARVLADHLPSAAIEVILRRKRYIVVPAPVGKCPTRFTCLEVYLQLSSGGLPFHEEEWFMNTATHLPSSVKVRLPDIAHPEHPIWARVTFSDYSAMSGLTIPTTTSVDIGPGRQQTIHVLTLIANGAFDPDHFDKELIK